MYIYTDTTHANAADVERLNEAAKRVFRTAHIVDATKTLVFTRDEVVQALKTEAVDQLLADAGFAITGNLYRPRRMSPTIALFLKDSPAIMATLVEDALRGKQQLPAWVRD